MLGATFKPQLAVAVPLRWLDAALIQMRKGLFLLPDFRSGGSETISGSDASKAEVRGHAA
jgi:hypothetical protein